MNMTAGMTGEELATIADGIGATNAQIAKACGRSYRQIFRARSDKHVSTAVATAITNMESRFIAAICSGDFSGLDDRAARAAGWIRTHFVAD